VGGKAYDLVLMASRLGPSTLLGYAARTAPSMASVASTTPETMMLSPRTSDHVEDKKDVAKSDVEEPPAKRTKTGRDSFPNDGDLSDDDEFLYCGGVSKQQEEPKEVPPDSSDPSGDSDSEEIDEPIVSIEVVPATATERIRTARDAQASLELIRMDRLDFAGPCVHVTDAFSPPTTSELSPEDAKRWKPSHPEGVSCTGLAHAGAMTTWHQEVRGKQLARVEDTPNVVAVWSVEAATPPTGASFVILSEPDRTRVKLASASFSSEANSIGIGRPTVVMEELAESVSNAFELTKATIAAGEMFSSRDFKHGDEGNAQRRIVQVTRTLSLT
jgi:hypothetical protein